MEASIRKATGNDYADLCDLFAEVDAYHRDNLPQIFQKPNGPVWEVDYYHELITDENAGLFVAERDQKLVGFVHAVLRTAPAMPISVPRRYAVVEGIGVHAECQDKSPTRILRCRYGQRTTWAGSVIYATTLRLPSIAQRQESCATAPVGSVT